MSSQESLPSQLFARYEALDPDQKFLIEILAVNFAPLTLKPLKSAILFPAKEKLDLSPLIAQELVVSQRLPGGGEGYRCSPLLIDLVMRSLAVDEEGFEAVIGMVHDLFPFQNGSYPGDFRTTHILPFFASGAQYVREIRIGFYLGDEAYIARIFKAFCAYAGRYYGPSWQDIRGPDAICAWHS